MTIQILFSTLKNLHLCMGGGMYMYPCTHAKARCLSLSSFLRQCFRLNLVLIILTRLTGWQVTEISCLCPSPHASSPSTGIQVCVAVPDFHTSAGIQTQFFIPAQQALYPRSLLPIPLLSSETNTLSSLPFHSSLESITFQNHSLKAETMESFFLSLTPLELVI